MELSLSPIPEKKIPYHFLNVWSGHAWYTIAVAVIVFGVGYLFSVFLYWLNLRLSWSFWYANLIGPGRKHKNDRFLSQRRTGKVK